MSKDLLIRELNNQLDQKDARIKNLEANMKIRGDSLLYHDERIKELEEKLRIKHLCNSCTLAMDDSCNHKNGYTIDYTGKAENVISCKHYVRGE